jgi:hypothetical protein
LGQEVINDFIAAQPPNLLQHIESCSPRKFQQLSKLTIMGRCKVEMIEQMQEEREDLEHALDDIEAFGEEFKWYVQWGNTPHCAALTSC